MHSILVPNNPGYPEETYRRLSYASSLSNHIQSNQPGALPSRL